MLVFHTRLCSEGVEDVADRIVVHVVLLRDFAQARFQDVEVVNSVQPVVIIVINVGETGIIFTISVHRSLH